VCKGKAIELVELSSPSQIDFLSTPKGRILISLVTKLIGRTRVETEHLLRTAERRSSRPAVRPVGHLELITFGYRDGYIVPVQAEEIDYDELYWR
jgi:hypothetical protein